MCVCVCMFGAPTPPSGTCSYCTCTDLYIYTSTLNTVCMYVSNQCDVYKIHDDDYDDVIMFMFSIILTADVVHHHHHPITI